MLFCAIVIIVVLVAIRRNTSSADNIHQNTTPIQTLEVAATTDFASARGDDGLYVSMSDTTTRLSSQQQQQNNVYTAAPAHYASLCDASQTLPEHYA
jgi:hypothetical protein